MTVFKRIIVYLLLLLISFFMSLSQVSGQIPISDKAKEIIKMYDEGKAKLKLYYGEPFIKYEYMFLDNEGLNMPTGVQYNHITNEVVVFDGGNRCIYIFSSDGKFKMKIGRPGQGPGEFMFPCLLTIDYKGNIYAYDGIRMQIFSKDGKLIGTFRKKMSNTMFPRIFVSFDDEIIMNNFSDSCYISVYNKTGELVKKLGNIDFKNKKEAIYHAREGIAFKGINKKYYVFLPHLDEIRIYYENGLLYKKISYLDAVEKTGIKTMEPVPGKKGTYEIEYTLTDVNYYNGNIFVLPNVPSNPDKPEMLYIFNHDLELVGKYSFGVYISEYGGMLTSQFDFFLKFDVNYGINEIEMFLPYKYSAEIIKYRFKLK